MCQGEVACCSKASLVKYGYMGVVKNHGRAGESNYGCVRPIMQTMFCEHERATLRTGGHRRCASVHWGFGYMGGHAAAKPPLYIKYGSTGVHFPSCRLCSSSARELLQLIYSSTIASTLDMMFMLSILSMHRYTHLIKMPRCTSDATVTVVSCFST